MAKSLPRAVKSPALKVRIVEALPCSRRGAEEHCQTRLTLLIFLSDRARSVFR